MCGLPNSSVSQWIWSQFTLADHVFVWLTNALYLISNSPSRIGNRLMTTYAPSGTSKRAGNQTRTNLEFVHDTLYAPNWGKSTQKEITSARYKPSLGSRNSPHVIIFPVQRLSQRQRINDVRLFEDEDFSVTLVSDRRQFPALLAQII